MDYHQYRSGKSLREGVTIDIGGSNKTEPIEVRQKKEEKPQIQGFQSLLAKIKNN